MSQTVHDYDILEREYVTTEISIRALAQKHGIKSWSTINTQKNKREWERKRADYRAKINDRTVDHLVGERLSTIATIHGELLTAIRAAVHRYVADLQKKEDPQPVSARDLMGLIDKFLLLTGQATERSESKHLELHDFGGILRDAPPELLRELAEVSRANGAGAQPVGRGPLVILEGTRSA
jgi:hypothetical protein